MFVSNCFVLGPVTCHLSSAFVCKHCSYYISSLQSPLRNAQLQVLYEAHGCGCIMGVIPPGAFVLAPEVFLVDASYCDVPDKGDCSILECW